ncbi:MAG: LTA synthase family protein, partial [Solobacterium sp.]|nr:LTA synthase family protein [Solobacterium sp.]
MKSNGRFSEYLIRLTVCMTAAELLFRFLTFPAPFDFALFRILLSTAGTSLFLASLCSLVPHKAGRIIVLFFCWLIGIYAVIQLGMKNYLGNYTSVNAGGDMFGRITEFIIPFIKALKPQYWLALVCPLICTFVSWHSRGHSFRNVKNIMVMLAASLILSLASYLTVRSSGLASLYAYPKYIEKSLREFGLSKFLIRDFLAVGKEEKITLDPVSTPAAQPTEEPEVIEEQHRTIDDSAWKALAESETDENVRMIDSWLMGRPVEDYNEMTGLLEGKNLIYIMIEAFDYIAVDEQLTPTLYMMKENGWDFTTHYTPKYSCTTGESEFISEISLIPESDVCTPNQYKYNNFATSIFSLFRNEGYYTSGYHNWIDEFYDRRELYKSSGCQAYLNYDDLNFHTIRGWQSDLELMELTVPLYINEDKFFTLYVTSSMHFPYDESSTLGDRYLNEINAVHPDYKLNIKRYISKAMELDKAMAYLLKVLEENGKLGDTAIVFFADHHPLNTPLNDIAAYTYEVDRTVGLNEDRTPFVIYCPSALGTKKLDEVNSTFDI